MSATSERIRENLAWVDVKRWLTPAFPETFLFTCTGDRLFLP